MDNPSTPPPQAALPEPAAPPSELQQCPTCGTTGKRSLVVCIDGTSNQFSVKNTNVVELYSRLVKDHDQRTFYNSGIGTYAKPHGLTPSQAIVNALDLAIAWRFDKVLLSAYRWLSENYEEGDRIFLFGFSRGAYQVRALSAMIEDVGLIHKGNQDQIPFAYKLYADPKSRHVSAPQPPDAPIPQSGTRIDRFKNKIRRVSGKGDGQMGKAVPGGDKPSPDTTQEWVDMTARFKKTFSRQDVKVHFVGVWDTVSSVGVVYDKTLPGTTKGMPHVCFVRHALAIHERRVKFLPEYVGDVENDSRSPEGIFTRGRESAFGEGANTRASHAIVRTGDSEGPATVVKAAPGQLVENQNLEQLDMGGGTPIERHRALDTVHEAATSDDMPPRVKEVWFAGSHSDIGGGNMSNMKLELFGPSLRWMSYEAALAGLRLADEPPKWAANMASFRPHRSLTGPWWVLEVLPLTRLSFSNPDIRDETVRVPHLGGPRRPVPGQLQHATVAEVLQVSKQKQFSRAWNRLKVEPDPYLDARRFQFLLSTPPRALSETEMNALERVVETDAGCSSIYDAASYWLAVDTATGATNHTISRLKRKTWGDAVLQTLLQLHNIYPEHDPGRALHATCAFFQHIPIALSHRDHRQLFLRAKELSRRYPSSARHLLKLSGIVDPLDFAPLLRDASVNTAVLIPGRLRAVTKVISNDDDSEVVIWDYSAPADDSSSIIRLAPHGTPLFLAVSKDGSAIACSTWRSFEVWDAKTGERRTGPVELSHGISALAFNPIGTLLIVGSTDGDVLICNPTATQDGRTLLQIDHPGHRHWVSTVAWADDGRYSAAGLLSGAVYVWHMETDTPTLMFRTSDSFDSVGCLAFSPDCACIVAGIDHSGVKTYTIQRGDVVRIKLGPLASITEPVSQVCFSSDGRYIAILYGSRGLSGHVRMIDTHTGVAAFPDFRPSCIPLDVAFDPGAKALRVFCEDGSIRLIFWTFDD